MIRRIDHVGIATRSITSALDFYRHLGLEMESLEVNEEQKVKVALLRIGESALELLEATETNSPISRFIRKRGEGVHHICLEVDDLQAHLEKLKSRDIALINDKPKEGAQGRRIAFVHPDSSSGVLIELSESREGV
jgi:methylmalonyl-CoA/ethylmalonyl-CoA epimerase